MHGENLKQNWIICATNNSYKIPCLRCKQINHIKWTINKKKTLYYKKHSFFYLISATYFGRTTVMIHINIKLYKTKWNNNDRESPSPLHYRWKMYAYNRLNIALIYDSWMKWNRSVSLNVEL